MPCCRETGKSCVLYEGIAWTRILRHVWKRGMDDMIHQCT
jgi:hypothetical protein